VSASQQVGVDMADDFMLVVLFSLIAGTNLTYLRAGDQGLGQPFVFQQGLSGAAVVLLNVASQHVENWAIRRYALPALRDCCAQNRF
jgi:hypothetical protein